MSTKAPLALALIQMASTPDVEENVAAVERWLDPLRGECDLAVFPENVFCLGSAASIRDAALGIDEWIGRLGPLTARGDFSVLFGSVPVRIPDGGVVNSSLLMAPSGRCTARYDKIHLFQLNPFFCHETAAAEIYTAGSRPVAVRIRGWTLGLSICYDLRFPELYRGMGVLDALICPAAFTRRTGEAHWSLLLRARAVENQCFAVGVGQCGRNTETGVDLYGHSLVADPWGEVLTEASADGEEVLFAELQRERLNEVRERLPALRNRRLR